MESSRINLDDLRRVREDGLAGGAGSGRWIKAAQSLMDHFPGIYEMAKALNAHLMKTWCQLPPVAAGHFLRDETGAWREVSRDAAAGATILYHHAQWPSKDIAAPEVTARAASYELLPWFAAALHKPDSDLTVVCWTADGQQDGYLDDGVGQWISCESGGTLNGVTHWAEPRGPRA